MSFVIFSLTAFLSLSNVGAQSAVGFTPYPIQERLVVGAEAAYDFSPSSGAGLGLRVGKQVHPDVSIDAGLALSSGERSRNLYVNAAYELFPDYGHQPAVYLKGGLEFLEMDDDTVNQLALSPIFSKGVSIVETPVYLFAALPFRYIVGDKDSRDSKLSYSFNPGAVVPLNLWTEGLLGTVEAHFNLRHSHNALTLGFAKMF
jgi:hypothetical protein